VFVRLLAGGVAWLSALFLFGALVQWSGSAAPELGTHRDGVTALARSLNQSRPRTSEGDHTWTVTKATSALRELVVEIDAVTPEEAPGIARHLVERVKGDYDEILVYVHALDSRQDPRIRRIEWTPTRGYLASAF